MKFPNRGQVCSGIRSALKVIGTFEGATSSTKFGQWVGFSIAALGFILSQLEHKEEPKSQAPPSPPVSQPGNPPQ